VTRSSTTCIFYYFFVFEFVFHFVVLSGLDRGRVRGRRQEVGGEENLSALQLRVERIKGTGKGRNKSVLD
jgi:hypothetical protein